jgi:serine/threonine-protein kinase
MSSEPASIVSPGDLVATKYCVEQVIGAGGMGVIVAANHVALSQRVAIKFLNRDVAARPEFVERFLREARAAARLTSDHGVKVFDVGTHDGLPFMVMELLDGEDLSQELARRGALPANEVVDVALDALEAVAEAHRLGIVHRDLKPSNLFRARKADGSTRIKVLDFGVSKLEKDDLTFSASLTSTKAMLGSPGYMSPEQVRSSKGVDARTDVWSMGVILYELLTGAPAFDGETIGDLFARIREEDIAALSSRRAGVPPGLEAIVMRCLQRDRAKRFADAGALREAIASFQADPALFSARAPTPITPVAHAGVSASALTIAAAPSALARAAAVDTMGALSTNGPARSRTRLAFVIAVGASVIVTALYFATRRPEPAPALGDLSPATAQPPSTSVIVSLPSQVSSATAPSDPPPSSESAHAAVPKPILTPMGAPSVRASARPAVSASAPPPPPPVKTAAPQQHPEDLGI